MILSFFLNWCVLNEHSIAIKPKITPPIRTFKYDQINHWWSSSVDFYSLFSSFINENLISSKRSSSFSCIWKIKVTVGKKHLIIRFMLTEETKPNSCLNSTSKISQLFFIFLFPKIFTIWQKIYFSNSNSNQSSDIQTRRSRLRPCRRTSKQTIFLYGSSLREREYVNGRSTNQQKRREELC
mgnify:CR=1 FL=1